ncbi:MAG: signal peptidase I [Chloroflexi bacterium]|nr:signal peptidase I [Chloroflexota bacterium]
MTDFSPENETKPAPESITARQEWKQFLREILETVGLAVILFLVINVISARVRVEGFSMLPTLDNGEYVLISRLAYKIGEYHRGDIIVFRPPMYPDAPFWQRRFGLPGFDDNYEDYIKRIIGLPGETVRIANGSVYINDVPLKEPYIAAPPDYSNEWAVPEGQLFVLGDNRNNSADSHAWGFLPEANVLGKALVVYWPFAEFKIIQPLQSVLAAP